MLIPAGSRVQDSLPREGELRWSRLERKAVRKAFDHALNQKLQEVTQQAEQMAAAI